MAGVVTMASVIEDFENQPCKKSGKDSGSPVVKTITNYFSPVPKPAEKPFSPPRSNNIMDYFSRKASLSKDKDRSPEQCNKNDQTSQLAEKDTVREPRPNHLPQKRKKASRAARKLVESENVTYTSEESSLIKEEQHESQNSSTRPKSSCGILGSDTAALLVRISAEACLSTGALERNATKAASLELSERDENGKDDGPKQGKHVKSKPQINDTELSPIAPSKEKSKQSRVAARSSRKVQQQRAKDTEQEEKVESSCDVAMEVNEDEASRINSMVTVSFEDFLQSQSQERVREDVKNEQVIDEDSIIITSEEEMDADPMEIPKAEENVASVEPPLQVSPRTLTIQAEVHAVSLNQNTAKGNAKLASIFNRRKGSINSAFLTSPCQTEAQQQLPAASLAVMRKSNVVLQEEDLELAVLDSESAPKCSEVERKQFMAAFKQPSLDGSKTKPLKSQSKQKQGGENVLEQVEKVSGNVGENPVPVDQEPAEHKAVKRKLARKDKRTVDEEKEAASTQPVAPDAPDLDPNPDPTVEKVISNVKVHDKDEESPITSAPSPPAVRRSRREAVVRQTPEAALTTPVRKTRKHNESKDAATVLPDLSPAFTSTTKRRRSKHGLFVAEMMCPPDTKQSPIRMKFTRIHKNVSVAEAQSGSGLNAPVDHKESTDTQKRKRVKKLVEKAKVIQHGKKTDITLRRSSRTEANTKKNFCEDEDSVICVEDDQTAAAKVTSEKLKTQKSLRSLNDVLGKAATADKEAKALTGSKMSSPVIEKPGRKVSAVISIFDDSSHDGSDSMQDDEQFRARRDFLKSGLPESFRKQIARTAASKEAYSLSCSSFQLVVHIKQQPNDCPLWSLPWPESLGHLKASWSQTCGRLPPVCGPVCVKTEPTRTAFTEQCSGWRPEISESVRQRLLEEVRASNPSFPVQMFMSRFLKRRFDPQQQQSSVSEPGAETRVLNTSLPAESVGRKRKRRDDEEEMTVKVAKKQRPTSSETSTPEPKRGGGRTRRGQRSRQEEGQTEKNKPSDVLKEDMLWTDKYQPQSSTDIIGNPASVRKLHSWLKEWKVRVDREERKKQKEKKQ